MNLPNNKTMKLDNKSIMDKMTIVDDIDLHIIEERQKDIEKINKDLSEIHDIFEDLAKLVVDQGGTINDIHSNVQKTHEKTEIALKNVKKAKEYYNKSCSIM